MSHTSLKTIIGHYNNTEKKKMKTKQELKDEGFIYISTNNSNGMEVWAKFTEYEDNIQYIDYKEGVYTGDIQLISFGRLCLYEKMLNELRPTLIKKDIKVEDRWT